MKKKRNFLLLILAVLFIGLFASSTSVSAFSLPKLQNAESGQIVQRGRYYYYRYTDKTYARNQYLRINKRLCYFNKSGKRWHGFHKVNGKKYYFGTNAQGYLYRNRLFRYKGYYYYASKDGSIVTGWHTTKSGKTYYFDSTGKAYTGRKRINKTNYYFRKNGALDHSGLKYNLSSDCALLINADTGKVLYSKNENLRHANASTTKIMTCILALDNSSLNDKVTFSKKAAAVEPSKLYAKAGETFYMRDLLYSLMVPSHNDTAIAIAEHISGSTSAFAQLMNKKARELGCTNTHFVTPNGLDAGLNHYTTASDLAIIARYAIKNPTFRKLINTKRYSFKSLNTKRYFTVATTNALLGTQTGVVGLKTGVTNKAGYCFVGLCRSRKGNTYISVTLGGPTSAARWRDSKILLTYAYKKG